MSIDAVRLIAAQSRSSAMQRTIISTFSSRKHSVAQWVHSFAQWLQASIQDRYLSWAIFSSKLDFKTKETPRMVDGLSDAFERGRSSAASTTSTGEVTRTPSIAGKHAAQMADSRRASAASSVIDLVHVPRPVTASKDPDFDQNLRENARQFQVAPVK